MSSLPNNRLNCGTIYDILSVKGAFHQIHTQSSVIFSLLKQKQEWPWQSDQGYLSLGLRLNIINKTCVTSWKCWIWEKWAVTDYLNHVKSN